MTTTEFPKVEQYTKDNADFTSVTIPSNQVWDLYVAANPNQTEDVDASNVKNEVQKWWRDTAPVHGWQSVKFNNNRITGMQAVLSVVADATETKSPAKKSDDTKVGSRSAAGSNTRVGDFVKTHDVAAPRF